jgi:hypothetical protein
LLIDTGIGNIYDEVIKLTENPVTAVATHIHYRMRGAFRQLQAEGKLHHGSGIFDYGDWAVWL